MLRNQRVLTEEISQMYVLIFAFVVLLFVADIIGGMAIKVKPVEIGTSATIICDHVENDPMVRVVQWYKSTRIDIYENGNPTLASWDEGATRSLPNYHMENTTLSLVIEKATLEDEGLYKCSVLRGDLFDESSYFIRTVMYALPRMDPLITLDTDSNRVHCTIEHVKPMVYPVLNFGWILDSTETYAVLNEDGTYTTSVCCALPQTRSASQVHCSFSYLHYQGEGSLDLRDITTDSLMENKTTTVSPMFTSVTSAGDINTDSMMEHKTTTVSPMGTTVTPKESTIGLKIALGFFTVASFMMVIVLMRVKLRGKYHRSVPSCNSAHESETMVVKVTT